VSRKKHRSLSSNRSRSQSVDIGVHATSISGTRTRTTLGNLSELATRRLMTDLILTLNASFPDYDFSNAKPQQFERLTLAKVKRSISERLSELSTLRKLDRSRSSGAPSDLVVEIFGALDSVVDLKECDIYSFEDESFLDESDHLWSFHYFFVNKPLRRLAFFTCSERIDGRRHHHQEPSAVDDEVEDHGEEEESEVMLPSEFHMVENNEFDYPSKHGDAAFSSGMSVPLYSII